MKQNINPEMTAIASMTRSTISADNIGLTTHYEVECLDGNGEQKWLAEFDNLVVNEGLDDAIDKYFKGSSYNAAFYVGLTDGTPTVAAGDTMAGHAGWAEVANYSEGTRPSLTLGSVASQSVDNSASKASFSVTASVTIGGCFVSTNSTKSGTSGTLYGGGAFSGGDKSADNGDTLNVTVTLTASAI